MYAYEYELLIRRNDNDTDLDVLLETAADDAQVTDTEYDELVKVFQEVYY